MEFLKYVLNFVFVGVCRCGEGGGLVVSLGLVEVLFWICLFDSVDGYVVIFGVGFGLRNVEGCGIGNFGGDI